MDYYFSRFYTSKDLVNPNIDIDNYNAEVLIKNFDGNVIDKIFSNTFKFESEQIYDFIQCLC